MDRVVIIGTSGSGKTTLAARLAEQLEHEHIELDALFWRPGWEETPRDEFKEIVARVCERPTWVIAGNYSSTREVVWTRADTLIWLNFDFELVMKRITRRTLERAWTGAELWGGNQETWRNVFSKSSMIWWSAKTWSRRRREYAELLADDRYQHLNVLEFATPEHLESWLGALARSSKLA